MSQYISESSLSLAFSANRKVTIYRGTSKYEATQVEVRRGPRHEYADAFHFQFKPKRARRLRMFVEDRKPETVIVDGWDHPEFDSLIRGFRDAPVERLSPITTYQMVSVTFRSDGNNPKDKVELEFEEYLNNLDPARILYDTRGAIITKK